MQLIDKPEKIPLPFAASGAKNAIPEASQIGITPGAASLTDGFPPLTRTPIASGGVPPSGLDMNGILYELSAVIRWANAGGGYPYDATFANDSNVNGYPKGARVLRSDGLGYWFNTVDNNDVNPESSGAVAAGWVPDFTTGAALVTMTSSNVTLTELEYGRPIIVLSGLLTSNLNLIFPEIYGQWLVVNNCTGAYTITAKTAAGSGILITKGANQIFCNQVSVYSKFGTGSTPAFSVNKNGTNQTGVVSNVTTKVTFSTKTFDTNNDFNTSTSTFSPTIPGIYNVSLCLRLNSSADLAVLQAQIYKNGVLYATSVATQSGTAGTESARVSGLVEMNGTSDYIEFFISQNTGSNRDILGLSSDTYASGFKI